MPALQLPTLLRVGTWGVGVVAVARYGTVSYLATPPQVAPRFNGPHLT